MSKNKYYRFFILYYTLNIIATLNIMAQESTISVKKDLEQLIQTIENRYAPDKRISLYSIEAIEIENKIQLKGETSHKLAHDELLKEAKKIYPQIKDSIRILPDKVIGKRSKGIIYNSVADIRSNPNYRADMVSQVLLGMPVEILDKSGNWHLIQTPDDYIGWVSGSLKKFTREEMREELAKPKLIVTSLYATTFSQADSQSQSVSDIVAGNILNFEGKEKNFYKVSYPDGRKAFIKKGDAKQFNEWIKGIKHSGESIVETAKLFMGIPYVWGGTSSKGLDCSGFTKTVFWLHGLVIARDASQQIKYGVEVDNNCTFENAQPGDLVFFGEKATEENPIEKVIHVGIYLGNKQFIHASDFIRINSFNPESELYDAYNTNRYLRTMRYIGYEGTAGITPIKTYHKINQ